MSIFAIVENGSVKLPVSVPDGTRVEITLPEAEKKAESSEEIGSFFDEMREFIGCLEGPEDLAAEHDHYIRGTPKRGAS